MIRHVGSSVACALCALTDSVVLPLLGKRPGAAASAVPTFTINENFTDNPMYPFSVTEPATVSITLYQVNLERTKD
jgi:hypothetical protein